MWNLDACRHRPLSPIHLSGKAWISAFFDNAGPPSPGDEIAVTPCKTVYIRGIAFEPFVGLTTSKASCHAWAEKYPGLQGAGRTPKVRHRRFDMG
jgi:hypothetical protein